MKKMQKTLFTGIGCVVILFLLVPAFALVTGCSDDGDDGDDDDDDDDGDDDDDSGDDDDDDSEETTTDPAEALQSGIFTDSPVSGLAYQGKTVSGVTDIDGKFEYSDGDKLSFSIGELYLGAAVGDAQLSPIDLVEGAADGTDQRVNNICVLLQTLDQDGDLNNGIQITSDIADIVTNYADLIDFDQAATDFAADSDVAELVSELNAANVLTCLIFSTFPSPMRTILCSVISFTPIPVKSRRSVISTATEQRGWRAIWRMS
jgi:para-nitrobenzyl esterase